MTRKSITRTLVLVAMLAFVLSTKPAWAQPPAQNQCFTNLSNCYYWAAAQATFWGIWAGGLDCELAFINCVRSSLIGY
jgi:hypothetical protein